MPGRRETEPRTIHYTLSRLNRPVEPLPTPHEGRFYSFHFGKTMLLEPGLASVLPECSADEMVRVTIKFDPQDLSAKIIVLRLNNQALGDPVTVTTTNTEKYNKAIEGIQLQWNRHAAVSSDLTASYLYSVLIDSGFTSASQR
jgi:hypothetical protein